MRVPTQRLRERPSHPSEAEKAAGHLLRSRKSGAKFRRPCRLEKGVVDFYCFEHRWAMEFEGGIHSPPSPRRSEAAQEDDLRTLGMGWLRIPKGLVLEDPEGFVDKGRDTLGGGHGTTPHPSRSG